mgnify:CR=1 FL=1
MKPNTEDFNALVGRVMASGSLAQMRPVVEKNDCLTIFPTDWIRPIL